MNLSVLPAPGLAPIKIDPAQIDQILANLCVNARDVISDTGTITIETRTAHLDEGYCAGNVGILPGEYAMLLVSDNGCGTDRGETILLVEDDATILEMARTVLERLEYRVLRARSPSEALRMAGKQACGVDLLLTDAIMPEMNGKDLSHRLLTLHPDLKLIYMSGATRPMSSPITAYSMEEFTVSRNLSPERTWQSRSGKCWMRHEGRGRLL